jgi:hypothetical protein
MYQVTSQKLVNESGKLTGMLIKKSEYLKLKDYIENLEDSLELADAIKESKGFRLWDNFVAEYKANHK